MNPFFRGLILTTAVPLLLLAACAGEDTSDMLASAKKYIEKNDSKAAIIQLKNALQKSSNSGEARYLLGKAFLQNGETVESAIELRKALDLHYPADQVAPLLAKAMLASQEYKKLTDQYENTDLSEKSSAADLKTSLALAYAAQGDVRKSRAALQAAFAAVPSYGPALIFEARTQFAEQHYEEAFASLDKALSTTPDMPEAWHMKGDMLLYGKGDVNGAMSAYRKAQVSASSYLPAQAAIISLLLANHDPKSARKEVDELRKKFPQSSLTKYFDAQLDYLDKDYPKARELAQQLLKIAPENTKVLQLSGAIEFEMNSLVQAENYLGKALQQTPNLPVARRLLAQIYLRTGQPRKALAVVDPLLKQAEPDVEALSHAADAYSQLGDTAQAKTYLEKVAKVKPEDVKIRSALALHRMNAGNSDATVAELQLLSTKDGSTYADHALVNAYLRKNNLDGALDAINALEKKQPAKPFAANLRGQVYLLRKDNARARRSFERALEIDRSFIPAAASLAALDLSENNQSAARKRFESILEVNPKNMQALLAVAGLQAAAGAPKDDVVELLLKAVKLNPDESAPRTSLIDYYLGLQEAKMALLVAQDAVAVLGDKPEVLDALGRAQVAAGATNQAIGTFSKLAQLQPNLSQAFMRLAGIHIAAKNYDAARNSLRQALVATPDLLEAQQKLIAVELATKRPEEALVVARTIQKQRPSEVVGYAAEGSIEVARQKTVAAIQIYQTALQKFDSPTIATKLHSVLSLSHKDAEAEKLAKSWLRTHPKDAIFPFYMGEVSLSKKDYQTAENYFKDVLAIQPKNPPALNNLAWITATVGKPGAVALAQRAVALQPSVADFLDTLAMSLAAENQSAQAIDMQKKALALAPENAMFRLRLAKLYIKIGDKSTARSELVALSKLNNGFGVKAEVEQLLNSL